MLWYPLKKVKFHFKAFLSIMLHFITGKIILDKPLTLINCLRTKQLTKQFKQKLTD